MAGGDYKKIQVDSLFLIGTAELGGMNWQFSLSRFLQLFPGLVLSGTWGHPERSNRKRNVTETYVNGVFDIWIFIFKVEDKNLGSMLSVPPIELFVIVSMEFLIQNGVDPLHALNF